jgi:paraquat-inducible protein B
MKRRQAHPALLGLFVVIALGVLFIAVLALAGEKWLVHKQKVVMHFDGSVYGLQVGAPVVFRGVRLGSVRRIGVAYDRDNKSVTIPVTAELDSDMLDNVSGGHPGDDARVLVPALVERGLRAQLSTQSLLTGQLYVDLDFRPDKPARMVDPDAKNEIPTIATAFQELRDQVGDLDLRRLVDDVSSIASTTRRLVSGPEVNATLKDLQTTAANLQAVTQTLNTRLNPMLDSAQGTMDSTRQAMDKLGQAAQRANETAQRLNASFGPDSALITSLKHSADELSRSAETLRQMAGDDGPLNQNLQRALQDVSKASRELRELATTLDEQPEALIRGRNN